MITYYQKSVTDKKLKTLDSFRVGTWLYIEKPIDAELDLLVKDFGLDRGLLNDALDLYEVPRVEIEDDILYIFTRIPYTEKEGANERIITSPLLVAVGKDFLMTLSSKSLPFLEKFSTGKINFSTTQKTRLLLQIFSEIDGAYNGFLNTISRNVRGTHVQLERIDNKDIVRLINFEVVLNEFLAALVPTSALLKNLLSGKFLKLYERDEDLVEDLFLGSGQLIESCKSNLKNIVNIRQGYSTIMTNNLNRVIKLLTALTIVLTVPTIVASLYGMNVRLPLGDSPFAFWWVVGGIGAFSAAILGIFAKNRWL